MPQGSWRGPFARTVGDRGGLGVKGGCACSLNRGLDDARFAALQLGQRRARHDGRGVGRRDRLRIRIPPRYSE